MAGANAVCPVTVQAFRRASGAAWSSPDGGECWQNPSLGIGQCRALQAERGDHLDRARFAAGDVDRDVDERQDDVRAGECGGMCGSRLFTSRNGACKVTTVSAGVSPFAGM